MRYELTDNEWSAIKPMLPNKPRGGRGQRRYLRKRKCPFSLRPNANSGDTQ
jgi:transposase